MACVFAGPAIGTVAATILLFGVAAFVDPASFPLMLVSLPAFIFAFIPAGYILGLGPAALCGGVLGALAAWRGSFSATTAALVGLATGIAFLSYHDIGPYQVLPGDPQNSNPLLLLLLLYVAPAAIAAVLCRRLAMSLGAFSSQPPDAPQIAPH